MNITILSGSKKHPVYVWLNKWTEKHNKNHQIDFICSKQEIVGGDVLFLISCPELIEKKLRDKFKKTLIIHASDLPSGRGWSPHIWSIINGEKEVVVTLLEAEDNVDSGDIWKKIKLKIPKTALYDEINDLIFELEMNLMDYAIEHFYSITPKAQDISINSSYWPRRTPADSEIDVNKSINEQFDLIRVCDPERFPAFFYKDGIKFVMRIEKEDG
jgi:methionyl-tRNA formyltransferase